MSINTLAKAQIEPCNVLKPNVLQTLFHSSSTKTLHEQSFLDVKPSLGIGMSYLFTSKVKVLIAPSAPTEQR